MFKLTCTINVQNVAAVPIVRFVRHECVCVSRPSKHVQQASSSWADL